MRSRRTVLTRAQIRGRERVREEKRSTRRSSNRRSRKEVRRIPSTGTKGTTERIYNGVEFIVESEGGWGVGGGWAGSIPEVSRISKARRCRQSSPPRVSVQRFSSRNYHRGLERRTRYKSLEQLRRPRVTERSRHKFTASLAPFISSVERFFARHRVAVNPRGRKRFHTVRESTNEETSQRGKRAKRTDRARGKTRPVEIRASAKRATLMVGEAESARVGASQRDADGTGRRRGDDKGSFL